MFICKKKGDEFVHICAKVHLIFLGRFSSDLLTVGASLFRIFLGGLSVRNFCTIKVCIVLKFCLMFSAVTVVGSVGMICVYVLFAWNIEFLMSFRLSFLY